jgi:hypothetical protein
MGLIRIGMGWSHSGVELYGYVCGVGRQGGYRLAGAHEGDVTLHVVLDLLLLAVHRLEDFVEL